jgi:hypothetical protein
MKPIHRNRIGFSNKKMKPFFFNASKFRFRDIIRIKQRWLCTYNVILQRFRVANVAVGKQQVLKIMMVCLYFCLNAKRMRHVVGCVMSGSTVFSHCHTNSKIVAKTLLNKRLDFHLKF